MTVVSAGNCSVMWARAIGTAVLVLASLGTGPGSSASPHDAAVQIRDIERHLTMLCGWREYQRPDVQARRRLAELWRKRAAALRTLPADRRAEVRKDANVPEACLRLAERAAAPTRHAKRQSTRIVSANTSLPPAQPPRIKFGARPPVTAQAIRNFFPWPPPEPSARRSFSLSQISAGAAPADWGAAADQIERILQRAEIDSWSYFLAADGFAVATRVEQIDEQTGAPLAGSRRWPSNPDVASSSGFLSGLFTIRREIGIYRTFVFVITTDPVAGKPVDDPAALFDMARHWIGRGAPSLSAELRSKPLSSQYQLIVLVYEFEHAVSGETKLHVPGQWGFDADIHSAGIALQP